MAQQHFQIVHQLARRLRISTPVIKNDQERAYILEIILKKRPEIKRVRTVCAIGCVVIDFDPAGLPKKNLFILLDAVLGNIANKNPSLPATEPKLFEGASQEIDLAVDGMSCASCALLIEMVLKRDERVKTASVNFSTSTLSVQGQLSKADVSDLVTKIGYQTFPMDTLSQRRKLIEKEHHRVALAKNRCVWASVLSIPVIVAGMAMTRSRPLQWMQWALTTPIVFWAGYPFFAKAWRLARQRAANMDSLIALGVGSAYGYSATTLLRRSGHLYFEAAAAIISFVLLGRYLEESAKGKAGEAIRQLVDLQPQTATRLTAQGEEIVDVDVLVVGDILLVRPGEKMPTDGIVIEGVSTVDESMVTGESVPVIKNIGNKVIGGCVNGSGVLSIQVSAVGMDTVLAGIVHMVDQAQSTKLPIQKQVDRISAAFVPSVIVLSAFTLIGWLLSGVAFSVAFGNAVTVLLIACPCALGLATPAAIMVGAGQAAREGIYIRNGESLETAAKLNVIVFDKTGTITEGKPKVTDVFNVSTISDDKLIQLAASAEHNSEHFLGKALVMSAVEKGLTLASCTHFHSVAGRGIEVNIDHQRIYLGNQAWLVEQHIVIDSVQNKAGDFATQGKTPVFMAIDGQIAAVFGISDKPRPQAAAAILRLKKRGIETLMVTGDTQKTANYIAAKVGIETVIANATPEQKWRIIDDYQAQGKMVGMIGDGINDAPALAAANVGFAIGTGTDVAIESADMTLVQGDISTVTAGIELSQKTIRVIKQNLGWAFGYNVIAIPIAAAGRLNPMIASAAMALSSVSVILNSLRLNKE